MIALVTGSTGFIGSHLCHALCGLSVQVRAFHRASSDTQLIDNLPVKHVIGDLTQPDTLVTAMEKVDVVFHTAAVLNSREGKSKLYAVNVAGTRAVLDAALQQGVSRVVYTSSVAALGVPEESQTAGTHSVLLNENHTWNFPPQRWLYGYSKYLSEQEVQYAIAKGLDVVIVNPSVVFGPGNIYRQSNSPVILVADKKLHVMVSAGMNVVHVQDVVAGHLAAWQKGKTGERYILGAHNVPVPQLLQKIARLTGGKAPGSSIPVKLARHLAGFAKISQSIFHLPVDPSLLYLAGYSFFYDTSKVTRDLELPPPQSLEKAILDSYDWFRGRTIVFS